MPNNTRYFCKEDFGRRLKKARTAARFTQVGLGELIGYNRQKIIDFENGKSEPTVSVAEKLSKVLDVSYESLIFGVVDAESRLSDSNRDLLEAIDGKLLAITGEMSSLIEREVSRQVSSSLS